MKHLITCSMGTSSNSEWIIFLGTIAEQLITRSCAVYHHPLAPSEQGFETYPPTQVLLLNPVMRGHKEDRARIQSKVLQDHSFLIYSIPFPSLLKASITFHICWLALSKLSLPRIFSIFLEASIFSLSWFQLLLESSAIFYIIPLSY